MVLKLLRLKNRENASTGSNKKSKSRSQRTNRAEEQEEFQSASFIPSSMQPRTLKTNVSNGRPQLSSMKSDKDLYNDLIQATEQGASLHDDNSCSTRGSRSSNGTARTATSSLTGSMISVSTTSCADSCQSPSVGGRGRSMLVDVSALKQRAKSPGHTGHERKCQFTFGGDILEDDFSSSDDEYDDFFADEGTEDGRMEPKRSSLDVKKGKAKKDRGTRPSKNKSGRHRPRASKSRTKSAANSDLVR